MQRSRDVLTIPAMTETLRSHLKAVFKELCPPFLEKFYKAHFEPFGWSGNYATWEEALAETTGYDSRVILEKVKASTLTVKSGEAVYERDSVLFDEMKYSWPILAGLLKIAIQNGNYLKLVDFGGSLGSSYFQNRAFLGEAITVRWHIVEQHSFVECGKQYFENEELRFFHTLDDCLLKENPKTLLLSSVLQYLEKPYNFIETVISKNFEWILVDRTPFSVNGKDRITVQKVQPNIYSASYPCWFFDETHFLKSFEQRYHLVATFQSTDTANLPAEFKGFIFNIRESEFPPSERKP